MYMMKKSFAVFLCVCVLTFVTLYLYHFHFLQNPVYDQHQIANDRTSVIRTSENKHEYKFNDDLLKSGAGFRTSEVLLYSAVARNTTEMSHWDTVSVFGFESKHLSEQVYTCCLLYPSGMIDLSQAERIVFRMTRFCQVIARHFACKLKKGNREERAIAVTLTSKENPSACIRAPTSYVDIDYPYKHSKEIAIFAKVVYGDLNARDLITWFEVHRLFGFSKVFMYPLHLNTNATRVLQYYQRLGLLEIFPFTIPGPGG